MLVLDRKGAIKAQDFEYLMDDGDACRAGSFVHAGKEVMAGLDLEDGSILVTRVGLVAESFQFKIVSL
jgi:hypothetical protein